MAGESTLTLALAYRLFFLWIEPLAIFLGGLQASFDPIAHLDNFTPIHVTAIRPEHVIVIAQLGACEIFMAGIEAFVLRLARHDLMIWKTVLGFELVGDVIHLYGIWLTMGVTMLQPLTWRVNEYINLGMLIAALMLRPAFLPGIGVCQNQQAGKKAIPRIVRERHEFTFSFDMRFW